MYNLIKLIDFVQQKELENKFDDVLKKNSEVSKKRLNESSLASGNMETMKETHDK